MELKIDFHVHSAKSPDGISPLSDILASAKQAGLDAIALTDHDILSDYKEGSIIVIPGCEFSTDSGHILGLFLEKGIELPCSDGTLPPAADICRAIVEAGGISCLAHPFERPGKDYTPLLSYLDCIEVNNSRACFRNKQANDEALELAAKHGKRMLSGSDAHSAQEVGNSYVLADCKDKSLDSIKAAVMAGNTKQVLVRNTPRIRKGLSQLAKCKKRKAPLTRMLKAYIYIVYCFMLDLIKR